MILGRQVRHAASWIQGAAAYVAGVPEGVRVSYGHLHLPDRSELAVGGIVKLQSLAEIFPSSPFRFNVLYLVSSRLPAGAVSMAAWAQRKGARLVLNQNGVAYPAWHGPGWQRTNRPMTELLRMADHVFYQSAFCKLSADRFAGAPTRTWEVLHNAVDTARFTPAVQRPAVPTLLLGGSQDQRYRFESAIRTLAVLKSRGVDARLVVTGRFRWTADEAACRSEAEAMVTELGLREQITFIGPYSQLQAPEIFRNAHLLLHTKYNDPCPAVVIEAMASGLPVVYSNSGGVPELVGDAGVGVPVEQTFERDIAADPAQLATAVERVLNDHHRLAALARARAVEHLDVRHWLDRHRAVFSSVVPAA